ncbi:CTP synthase [Patescibacteria group bacterium]|nr:CTP synthase [Patescibacteria group bacterium]
MARFIFIAGGVMSGIGKGVSCASIGRVLQSKGFSVTALKIDPYINVDAGTMDLPVHGEVFVTEDGDQCDQDMGNYERFLDENLSKENYMTTGRVYQTVINRERNLEYGGKCVEVVPHIPEEVIRRIKKAQRKQRADFCLIEIGGTVGEYQNLLFLEAARMMKLSHPKDVIFILVSYLPIPKMIGEMKTKPTQNAVKSLNMSGIQPDIILGRSPLPLDESRKRKISNFCNVAEENVISAPDIKSIYEIPINFEKENLGNQILKSFDMKARVGDLKDWEKLIRKIKNLKKIVKIGIVEKYFKEDATFLTDCYLSLIEAIKHAAWFSKRRPEIHWLSAEEYEKNSKLVQELKKFDGIIIPSNSEKGTRSLKVPVEGKIRAIEFCRENKIPFLGLCLGMQLAVVEFARNICKLKGANSTEFAQKCQVPVIDVMLEQKERLAKKNYGGTMRLGAYPCRLTSGTLSRKAYGSTLVSERHRHRYELNNEFRDILEKKGMLMAGINPERNLVEIIEIPDHPFFVAIQFHPEFKSRPLRPHPLFREFIRVCLR